MRRGWLEIATFAALAWYAAAHWADGLVADAPGARVFACVVIACAVAIALRLLAMVRTWPAAVLRVGCVLAGLGAGCVAIGVERRLLAPAHWDELADGLDRGFAALGSIQWPYDGPEPWAALVLLLAIPVVLGLAAACAFWGRRGRPAGLVLVVALYATAVTEHQFGGELARGAGLLVLVAAWLWLPQMPERGWRTAAAAAAALLVACTAALPAAARFDEREAWVDYESWNPFAAQAATRFDWSHSYGPMDWPRDGTTLMYVRSDKRHYWRLETLDEFDGLRWLRSGVGRNHRVLLPDPYHEEWERRFTVTISDLDTDLFPVAGTMIDIDGAGPIPLQSDDGTVEATPEGLDEGDSYDVTAYVPSPSPEQMRSASSVVPAEILFRYAGIYLPAPGRTALDPTAAPPGDAGPVPATAAEIAASPYARVQRLARRLARNGRTTYDVVRAVQRHLRSEYTYNERPPTREYPLAAFLFEDRVGYCQQFSGAMALMLRMLGVPARVAAGFTPGSYNRDTKEYRVRDLDAHSWVEVWFTGLGWVPFDPTPSIAPADSQSSADDASAGAGAGGASEIPDRRGADGALSERAGDGLTASGPEEDATGVWLILGGVLALAGLGLSAVRLRSRRIARRLPPEEAEVAGLRRALARVGEPVPPRLTLRQIESRLERTGGAPAARYVRMLRERRYGPRGGRGPDAAARRDLRRALARGRGLRGRIAAVVALPPASFRRG